MGSSQYGMMYDESHLNRYIIGKKVRMLFPSYVFPEGWQLPFEPKIIVRDKMKYGGHAFLRDTNDQGPTKHVIVIRLLGGLGNQMFQYACARSLANHTGSRIILDTCLYDHNVAYRKYELSVFAIKADVLSDGILPQLPDELNVYEEDSWCTYEKGFYDTELPCFLIGYWQSWKYFQSIGENIRADFCFRDELISPEVKRFEMSLSQASSVGIHIRRTDYANNPQGILPLQYYQHAVEWIQHKVNDPVFYVFSDDPDWIESYFDIPVQFQIIRGHSGMEDMYLMSRCQHNIIANSSFSWWAAWLNSNPDKMVIAPQKWLLGEDLDVTDTDLIPPEWVCIW